MSRGPWKSKPAKEAQRLIEAVEAKGYAVTSVEIANGAVRLGVRRPGEPDATVESSESVRELGL
jgi:hypothetical protein